MRFVLYYAYATWATTHTCICPRA